MLIISFKRDKDLKIATQRHVNENAETCARLEISVKLWKIVDRRLVSQSFTGGQRRTSWREITERRKRDCEDFCCCGFANFENVSNWKNEERVKSKASFPIPSQYVQWLACESDLCLWDSCWWSLFGTPFSLFPRQIGPLLAFVFTSTLVACELDGALFAFLMAFRCTLHWTRRCPCRSQ